MCVSIKIDITTNIAATNTATQVYSRLRKAMAPSRMFAAIDCIFSLPGSAANTICLK